MSKRRRKGSIWAPCCPVCNKQHPQGWAWRQGQSLRRSAPDNGTDRVTVAFLLRSRTAFPPDSPLSYKSQSPTLRKMLLEYWQTEGKGEIKYSHKWGLIFRDSSSYSSSIFPGTWETKRTSRRESRSNNWHKAEAPLSDKMFQGWFSFFFFFGQRGRKQLISRQQSHFPLTNSKLSAKSPFHGYNSCQFRSWMLWLETARAPEETKSHSHGTGLRGTGEVSRNAWTT